jgi:hypothetical protein
LASSEWLADAADGLRVKQEDDDAKAERALQRRRRKTEVIDLRRAIPTANEREDDEALEVPGGERDEEDEGEAPSSTPRSSLPSSGTLRRFGMARTRREVDEGNDRILADGPPTGR